MPNKPDVRIKETALWFLPVETRVPLKFGTETLTSVICARARVRVEGPSGVAEGWGETPLSVQWVWPSALPYDERLLLLKSFSVQLAGAWATFPETGHPLEIGTAFQEGPLVDLLEELNEEREDTEPMPWLAALVCCSPFDIALHDAYGQSVGRSVYETYNAEFMNRDLADFLAPVKGSEITFMERFPDEFVTMPRRNVLPAWHLVGGKDPVTPSELTGEEPDDGYPVLLADWIARDGLKCLKVKLRGNDAAWDYDRLIAVGQVAMDGGADWLSTDFNCTVREPEYVTDILDRLMVEHPHAYGMILYVEQPFPYDLDENRIDVHPVSARKPLFMDESAHDWRLVRLGHSLGWTGVALKTCKTQTGALLTLCWAKAHGMALMVQDLTNPMLAQIPHVLLAAHADTIMGVETNSMQFYPEASRAEESVHPGIFKRRNGCVDLSTIEGPGFGYKLDKIRRKLPKPAAEY